MDGCFRRKAETESNALCSDVVEARRIELLSENSSTEISPSAVFVLEFPTYIAQRQAICFGSFIIHGQLKALRNSRSPLFDALT